MTEDSVVTIERQLDACEGVCLRMAPPMPQMIAGWQRGGSTMTSEEPVEMPRWQCERCGYRWIGRVLGRRPKCCPQCHNTAWHRPHQRPSVARKMRAIWAQRAAETEGASSDASC